MEKLNVLKKMERNQYKNNKIYINEYNLKFLFANLLIQLKNHHLLL